MVGRGYNEGLGNMKAYVIQRLVFRFGMVEGLWTLDE